MTVYELLQRLEHLADHAANGAGEKVISADSEVWIDTTDGIFKIRTVAPDCFEVGEPWLVVIETGSPAFEDDDD